MLGACPPCGAAGTLAETMTKRGGVKRSAGAAPGSISLQDVETRELERLSTGIDELDRVLGGGLVRRRRGADRRRPGHRQVDAAAAGACRAWQAQARRSTSPARNRPSRWRCARAAWRWTRAHVHLMAEIQLEKIPATLERAAARRRGDGFDPDAVFRGADFRARLGGAGARMRGATRAPSPRQPACTDHLVGHVTKEGAHRRAARAGAHRRHRALFRRRHRIPASAWCARSKTASARSTSWACSP